MCLCNNIPDRRENRYRFLLQNVYRFAVQNWRLPFLDVMVIRERDITFINWISMSPLEKVEEKKIKIKTKGLPSPKAAQNGRHYIRARTWFDVFSDRVSKKKTLSRLLI